jgi:hypothetical protein
MADPRTLLAAALGLLLGGLCLAAPGVVIRAHTVGRDSRDRRGGYGSGGDVPGRWRRVVRVVGVGLTVVGGYFGYVAYATPV